jgi:integrase
VVVATNPCKKAGHTERNKHGQCIECLRASRRQYKARKRALGAALPLPAPVAVPGPSRHGAAVPHSFLAVAQEWLQAQDNAAPRTVIKRTWLLEQLTAVHERPIGELTTPDFVRALKAIEGNGDRRETAHRCGMLAGQITRYAVNHGYAPVNVLPAGQLRGTLKPIKVESHAAITDPRPGDTLTSSTKRFGRLLVEIDLYAIAPGLRSDPSVSAALLLAPHVFVRPSELRTAEWSEINLDKAEWVVPASKMKMRRPHLVPLSTQALALLRNQHARAGKKRHVFPAKG